MDGLRPERVGQPHPYRTTTGAEEDDVADGLVVQPFPGRTVAPVEVAADHGVGRPAGHPAGVMVPVDVRRARLSRAGRRTHGDCAHGQRAGDDARQGDKTRGS